MPHSNNMPKVPASDGTPTRPLSRRLFMTAAAAAGAAVGVGTGHTASGQPAPRSGGKAKRVRWRFEARRVEESFLDGSTVPFFRYFAIGNTRSNGRLPLMQDTEGKKVTVSINNTLDFPIQPAILDYDTGPVIMPRHRGLWRFTMPPAGTWIFTESLLGIVASSAGFAAAMISNPKKPQKPQRDYYLLYQDADDRWNQAIDMGEVPDESVFEPNYHTLNGLTFPETTMDKCSRVNCFLGEDVLVRVANLSNTRHALHFHGYHALLVKRNNKPFDLFPEKDTFSIPAFSTSEIIMPVTQVGEYPLHPHSLTATTDNGLYQGGSVTMIDAQER